MDILNIKFRTAGKGLPPEPLRLEPGKRFATTETASDPHGIGAAYAEAATYGLELVYQYEKECHVVNDNGQIRFDWDFANEPGGVIGWDEFSDTVPRPSKSYIFATSVDLQAPPGYVLRTQPHPRFFTDSTGTVPAALCGQVMTEWWPKKLFVVFKSPESGQRHIFRKGEPYVQILFVPQHTRFETPDTNDRIIHVRSLLPKESGGSDAKVALADWDLSYRTSGHAFPPQPVRMAVPGWGGLADKKRENGSEPQPWHCPPFFEGGTYGLELAYQHAADCHIVNDDGRIRIRGDWGDEAGEVVRAGTFPAPGKEGVPFYVLDTGVDLQVPPGHVVHTQPHPRFFTDPVGTVPAALCGHFGSDEQNRRLFVAFKAPEPGRRHILRYGDPYVQILLVPRQRRYEVTRMPPEEEAARRQVEDGILLAKTFIAKRVWHTPEGLEFNDHYRILERAFEHGGTVGVREAVQEAIGRYYHAIPRDKTVEEYLDLAAQYEAEGKYVEAKEILLQVDRIDSDNPEAVSRMGALGWKMGLRLLALGATQKAAALQPTSAEYRRNLGELLHQMGDLPQAEASLHIALQLKPQDPQTLSSLGLVLDGQGLAEEGLQACRSAAALGPQLPVVHFRLGSLLAKQHQDEEARACYEAALALKADYAEAKQGLDELKAGK